MGSVREQQSGVASGVLNMTRGMGTALGLALTGLVFDLAGGTAFSPDTVDHAFSLAALLPRGRSHGRGTAVSDRRAWLTLPLLFPMTTIEVCAECL